MSKLMVSKAKPNPSGKDRTRHGGASSAQLAGEWCDIKNVSDVRVSLNGVDLYHHAYSRDGKWEYELVVALPNEVLGIGETLRVHSGSGPYAVVREEDKVGAHMNIFTGRDNYVWNNDHGDEALLWYRPEKQRLDAASYDPNPPEGVVLVRVGDKLVVGSSSYTNR